MHEVCDELLHGEAGSQGFDVFFELSEDCFMIMLILQFVVVEGMDVEVDFEEGDS